MSFNFLFQRVNEIAHEAQFKITTEGIKLYFLANTTYTEVNLQNKTKIKHVT